MAFNLEVISGLLVKIAGFIVIFALSLVTGRVAGKMIERLLNELELNKMLRKIAKRRDIESYVGAAIRYAVYIAGLAIALWYLGVGQTVYLVIILVIAGLAAIFIMLNLIDLLPNLIARIYRRKFHIGDEIDVDGIKGRIMAREFTGYLIKTDEDDNIRLPYSIAKKLYK